MKSDDLELPLFEEVAHNEDIKVWYSSDLMRLLGYGSYASLSKVINKAMGVCASLGVDISEAFVPCSKRLDGRPIYKLTRFACFLVAMHADERKGEVKEARVYLAAFAAGVLDQNGSDEDFVRLDIRDELKDSEKMLASAAKVAGLRNGEFGIFKDAGFRGMYNMPLQDLKKRKCFSGKGTLYDYMDKTELAGNFFRVTQTTERIKSTASRGLKQLATTAVQVGAEVRKMMIHNSGVAPESLPLVEDVNLIKKRLKIAEKEMRRIDVASS